MSDDERVLRLLCELYDGGRTSAQKRDFEKLSLPTETVIEWLRHFDARGVCHLVVPHNSSRDNSGVDQFAIEIYPDELAEERRAYGIAPSQSLSMARQLMNAAGSFSWSTRSPFSPPAPTRDGKSRLMPPPLCHLPCMKCGALASHSSMAPRRGGPR
jgi:hypothetical protein